MADEIVPSAPTDYLERTAFIQGLEHHITDLASVPLEHLPAPRVLAVDAPWGSGKTWVAKELLRKLTVIDPSSATLIDAFRYDHHSDPFAVIAAAIIKTLAPKRDLQLKLINAAAPVLKVAAPVAIKWLIDAALDYFGVDVDDLLDKIGKKKDDINDSVDAFSEKSIEKLFESYSNTEKAQQHFIDTLSEVTKTRTTPFVVIIDELDRCRPTFALEVLERIKHLFTADKVVFVLFWNKASLHESIRHTYGANTKSETYLDKFVALSIPLPITNRSNNRQNRPYARYDSFIEHTIQVKYRDLLPAIDYYKDVLSELAEIYDASVRDVEKALHYMRVASVGSSGASFEVEIYLLFMLARNSTRFKELHASSSEAFAEEHIRLQPYAGAREQSAVTGIAEVLKYMSKLDHYKDTFRRANSSTSTTENSDTAFAIDHATRRTEEVMLRTMERIQRNLTSPAQRKTR